MLPAHTADLLATLAEALAKLLLHQRAWLRRYALPAAPGCAAPAPGGDDGDLSDSQQQQARLLRRALSLLLLLQFHPATEGADRLRQCLPVFFDAFASGAGPTAAAHRLQLVTAVLPAAQQALVLACKKQPAPLLIKFVMQLLQAGAALSADAAPGVGMRWTHQEPGLHLHVPLLFRPGTDASAAAVAAAAGVSNSGPSSSVHAAAAAWRVRRVPGAAAAA